MFDPRFFLAVVTSNEDPDMRGRVRIRIMGIHTEITTPNEGLLMGIEEKDLPFAQCMYPVTYTGTGGTCPPPSLQPGDWVLGVSLDGPSYQNLMVLGLAKAKFNAESLADGSLNANDAFANVQAPLNINKTEEEAAKAQEAADKAAAAQQETEFKNYESKIAPEYDNAVQVAKEWNSGGAHSTSSCGISTGDAVFNILSSLNSSGSPKMVTFGNTSMLGLNTNAKTNDVVDVVQEGYFNYCWKYYNDKAGGETSSILPTYAFKIGCGDVDDLLSSYGDPRSTGISYAQFYNNMKNDGKTAEAAYFKEVMTSLNKKGKTKATLTDANLAKYKNHQYLKSEKIATKSLRILGDVVFPTIRSTVTQTQQMLPYYCKEGGKAHEHIGVDLATGKAPVLAFAAGTVISARTTEKKDCNAVVILHKGGIKTLYMHMVNVLVKKGDKVKAGQQIGTGGGAGANGDNTHSVHLHFAVKKETKIVDPETFLRKEIGFAVNTISTASHYREGPLAKTDRTYRELQALRTSASIPWGF